jgi:hypothetical protein
MGLIVSIKKKRKYHGPNIVGMDVPKTWQGLDNVFLHKSQVKVGLRLINYGRLYHGTLWEVVEVKTVSPGGRVSKIDAVKRLNDIVVLLRVGSNETTQLGFTYLSYSAIWRTPG